MKIEFAVAAGMLVAAMPHVAEAGWRPLSQEAIETAPIEGWQAAVREANAIAATAQRDPTIPAVQPAEDASDAPGEDADITAEAPSTEAAVSGTQDVVVTGEPDLTVASPAFSTDLPDQAGLATADEPTQPDPFLIRLQVLLDRAHASPGAIDGFDGENTRKAIAAYEAMRGLPEDGKVDPDLWVILSLDQG